MKKQLNMEICCFLLLSYLIKYIRNREIYQCSRYNGMIEQCLNKWVDIYGNTRIDLWKCPTNKYCQILSRKDDDNSIGLCTFNFKRLYDKDYCSYHSDCSSLFCTDGKCQGIYEGGFCIPGKFQCMNNLVCRKKNEIYPYGELKEVYKCSNLSKLNETCENDNECDVRLVCDNKNLTDIINDAIKEDNITILKDNITFKEYISMVSRDEKICIQRATLENGSPTQNPMSCISGDIIDYELFDNYYVSFCASKKEIIQDCDEQNICIIRVDLGKYGEIEMKQNCLFTVRGNSLCPLNEKEKAWNNYLSTYEKYYKIADVEKNRDSNIHIPACKNTFNIFEVSQSFWHYTEWIYTIEADSCTQEYFFLRNKASLMNFSLFYLIINSILLFI
jgi:hypothetical protein